MMGVCALPKRINGPLPRRRGARILAAIMCMLIMAAAVLGSAAVYPAATGSTVYKKNGTVIDASNASDGYIIVHHKESKKRLKLRIIKDETYTYDLNSNGRDEVFPLQMGSGKYEVRVYENVSGKKYSQASSVKFSVDLNDENAAFLCPSQYVLYTADSPCVKDAEALCAGASSARDKFEAVSEALTKRMQYDYIAALTVTSGYLPDIDAAYAGRMGICFDMAAVTCAMLRSQGVPAKLVIGYADKQYHAWNEIWLDGKWEMYDLTMAITRKKVKNYSVERFY